MNLFMKKLIGTIMTKDTIAFMIAIISFGFIF
jgi:hypothetical protein